MIKLSGRNEGFLHVSFHVISRTTLSVFVLASGCKKSETCLTCPPQLVDTTSHNIQWIVDSLSERGLVRDVWVFSQNNVIAVGEFDTPRSDSGLATPYNVAYWNGQNWQRDIVYYSTGGHHYSSPLYAICAFSESDIWFGGNGLVHWDGQSYVAQDDLVSIWGPFLISRIWGTSSSDLFVVGDSGSLAHYDGSWIKVNTGTRVNLQDVWGTDANHVWATGYNDGDGHCVILQDSNGVWRKIYDSTGQPFLNEFQFASLWTDDPTRLYLVGGSFPTLLDLSAGKYSQLRTPIQYVSFRIRALKANDMFIAAEGSEVGHYNGSTWYKYPELKVLNGGSAWFLSVQATKDFVVLGGFYYTGINTIPVVLRGYR